MSDGFTYVLSSDQFVGEITLTYDKNQVLERLESTAQLSDHQRTMLSRVFPLTYAQLTRLVGESGGLKAKLLPPDLSFEVFWKAYNYPTKKARAQPLWEKLSNTDKVACLNSLTAYAYYLSVKNGIERQYPDTYLRQRRWEDDFKAMAKAK